MHLREGVTEAYAILGLEQGSSLEEVKSAYKQVALRTHPDKNPDNPSATQKFQKVSEAYRILLKTLDRSNEADDSDSEYEYGDYEEDDGYMDYIYMRLYEMLMRGEAHAFYARAHRRQRPKAEEESKEQYEARLQRVLEEQRVAEGRRQREATERKAKIEREREEARKAAEERQRLKLLNKRASAKSQRKKDEETIRLRREHSQLTRSAVFAAARAGDAKQVEKAIWEGDVDAAGGEVKDGCQEYVSVQPTDPLETLLHIAAKRGDIHLLRWLDGHGAEPEERNTAGFTAFHVALQNGHISMVTYFFDEHAPGEDTQGLYDTPLSTSLLSLAVDSLEPELIWMILDKKLAIEHEIGASWDRVNSQEWIDSAKTKIGAEKVHDIQELLIRYGEYSQSPQAHACNDRVAESSSQKPPTRATGSRDMKDTLSADQFHGYRRGQGLGRGHGRGRGRGRVVFGQRVTSKQYAETQPPADIHSNMGRLAEMQRKLLEQMMGPEAMGVANANLVWSDEKVCRNFLCGTCPHALFTNTKMDLGACPKSHTERLKTEYIAAKEANPNDPIFNRFQMEYESNIFAFVDECDRRIRAAHRRLEKTPEENAKTTNLMREIAEIELAIQGGTEKIETLGALNSWGFRKLTDSSDLGEQGKVDESMREMAAIEALKSEKAEKERELQQLTDTSGASGHQKLRVCDVCGAYLSVLDSDRRLADHFGGKMHLGYHELRNMLSKFREEREKRKMAPPSSTPAPGVTGSAAPTGTPSRGGDRGSDHRSTRGGEEYRDRERGDRDRGYERHSSSRYESVSKLRGYLAVEVADVFLLSERRRDRDRSRSPGRRRY
ncbi:hypothetical protein H0H81_000925 [Sphagnurus paluster]|uniref:J domain-containing protein n=1 Tax=Sphagnurus paluster TaxID=117069 RepID=A0A9P7K6M4_9AGAR|nr:hypothetical protein H0H81_000925 [Sphagnurus paluster]